MQFSQISEFDTPIHGVFEADKPYTNYSTIPELLGIKRPESSELIKLPPKIDDELLANLTIAELKDKLKDEYPKISFLRLAIMKLEARERLQLGPEIRKPPPKIDDELLANSTIAELKDKLKDEYPKISPLRLARMKLEARERLQLGPEIRKPPPKIDGELLVGLSIADAEHKYPGIDICPCKIDGVGQLIFLIYCPTRYLVEIENNKISKYIRNA
jgi:hypothetical protein